MFLKEEDKKIVRRQLTAMTGRVRMVNFTQTLECQYCQDTRQLLEELAALSELLSLEVYNFQTDRQVAEQYGVTQIPATVLVPENNPHGRVKFYGIPAGYEFNSLLDGILDLSTGQLNLPAEIEKGLASIKKPVHLQVFVTPTCPYCPAAVRTAHKFAILNPLIRAEMVEAIEFPHLAQRYSVRGVPRTIVNEKWSLEGAVPPVAVLAKIREALAENQAG